LSEKGIRNILDNQKNINDIRKFSQYSNVVILSSPLLRSIQTSLLTFNETNDLKNKNIYLCPLVSELGFLIENYGYSRQETISKIDKNFYINRDCVNIDSSDFTLFFFDSGYKKVYNSGWLLD